MPKPEKDEWRLVSDFTPLNIHIRKLQNVAPTIQDAKKVLAKYKYNIECDLSHYFFQGGMKKENIQYLATPHPYKGLRVYCVEPQGLRNASEHAYERLGHGHLICWSPLLLNYGGRGGWGWGKGI